MDEVLAHKYLLIQPGQGVLHQFLAFLRAEQNPDGRVVTGLPYLVVVVSHVGVELGGVRGLKGIGFELEQDVASEQTMVKDQVYEVGRVDN